LRDKVLEVRKVDERLHIARKPRHHDDWDPYSSPTIRMNGHERQR
jgi:hypothetical protein